MEKLQKAVESLEQKGISAFIENGTVYINIDGIHLELSQHEINFQAETWVDESE